MAGGLPIAGVTAPELVMAARRVADLGALETALGVLQTCRQVFRYAVQAPRAERDPSGDLRDALPTVKSTYMAAITEPRKAAQLLRASDGYSGTLTVACALRLAPLVFGDPVSYAPPNGPILI